MAGRSSACLRSPASSTTSARCTFSPAARSTRSWRHPTGAPGSAGAITCYSISLCGRVCGFPRPSSSNATLSCWAPAPMFAVSARAARSDALRSPSRRAIHGGRLSADSAQRLLDHHVQTATTQCPSLRRKRVSPRVLPRSAAMELFQADVDCSVIALWLGHESINTTQVYLHPHLALIEARWRRSSCQTAPNRDPL